MPQIQNRLRNTMRGSMQSALVVLGLIVNGIAPQTVSGQTGSRAASRIEPVFSDDFESGNYKRKQAGGSWTGGGSGNVHVGPGGADGSRYALNLIHRAKGQKGMSSAEQRFVLEKGVTELWLEYDFYLPKNFQHRGTRNNKFLALWEEKYGGVMKDGVTPTPYFLIEFRPMNPAKQRGGRVGDSYLYVTGHTRDNDVNRRFGTAVNAFTDAERGRWNKVKLHIAIATDDKTNDGIVELSINERMLISNTRLALPSKANGHYLRRGYFLGWSNSGYDEDMNFKIDNVRIYDRDPNW
jgi:hypothetical protein